MKNKATVLCILGLFVTAACFVAGCGRDESATFATPGGTVKVTAKQSGREGVVTVETKEGAATIKTRPQAITRPNWRSCLSRSQVVSSGQFADKNADPACLYLPDEPNDSFDKVPILQNESEDVQSPWIRPRRSEDRHVHDGQKGQHEKCSDHCQNLRGTDQHTDNENSGEIGEVA